MEICRFIASRACHLFQGPEMHGRCGKKFMQIQLLVCRVTCQVLKCGQVWGRIHEGSAPASYSTTSTTYRPHGPTSVL